MRRNVAAIATICGLLAVSTLGASTTATATPRATGAQSAPAAPEGMVPLGQAEFEALLADSSGTEFSTMAVEEGPVAIQSLLNGQFATAEMGYSAPNTGLLRARSDWFNGSWEKFTLVWEDPEDVEEGEPQTFGIRSEANDLYVAVEKNMPGDRQNMLRARSAGIGGWETFTMWYYEEAPEEIYLRSELNGLFVSVEKNYGGSLQYLLRARTPDAATGTWETFVYGDTE
ncbi:fascin domain-containing protein [Streptomyces litchfieldiae]|uniref:Uncharacterized protein n=1 Tax=Streptomyces litchfieldiae TaxID=3075543 RepID=A0ABU2MMM8_9ACTN|nr:hypothetical protein [Streptomyces sp. DSM 44938]MDT0342790.1 hypothetical protein [Streptomyces sp. DSM 44938]